MKKKRKMIRSGVTIPSPAAWTVVDEGHGTDNSALEVWAEPPVY